MSSMSAQSNIAENFIKSMEDKQDRMMDLQIEQGKTLVAIRSQLEHINSTIDINKKEQEEIKKLAWSSKEDIRGLEYRVLDLEKDKDKREEKKALWERPLIAFCVKAIVVLVIAIVVSYGELIK